MSSIEEYIGKVLNIRSALSASLSMVLLLLMRAVESADFQFINEYIIILTVLTIAYIVFHLPIWIPAICEHYEHKH